ncbi:MAG TPA: addiction module protein [Terriglobales bacterium]|nr:addiction module protein [Terriglobales bacterium]
MTQQADELLKKALSLPAEDRATLAGCLIESLDPTSDASAEQAWSEEISHRIQELDSGKARTLPWEEIRRRISTKLGDGR